MSCCGNARGQLQAKLAPGKNAHAAAVLFEYVGRTRLVIIGAATRTSYRFDRPGARSLVDGRDRASLATIPVLRQVGG